MDQGEQRLYNDPSPPSTDVEPASTKLDEAGHETPRMAHDSMVTVRLSEPPTLTLDTNVSHDAASDPLSVVDANNHFIMGANQSELSDTNASNHGSRDSTATIPSIAANQNLQAELEQIETEEGDGESSDDQEEVDWEQLEKKEDEQAKDDDTDDNVSYALTRLFSMMIDTLRSQRHFFWPDLNKRTPNWLRTRKASRSKPSRASPPANLAHLPWPNYGRWWTAQHHLRCGTPCCRLHR